MPHRPDHHIAPILIDSLDPGLFFGPDGNELWHATFSGGVDRELVRGGAVTQDGTGCEFDRLEGRTARMCPTSGTMQYGTDVEFIPIGNQMTVDIRTQFDDLAPAVSMVINKGINTATDGTAFFIAATESGIMQLAVRLSDNTQLMATSGAGQVSEGNIFTITGIYNGQAGMGNDTLALYVDGTKIASVTNQASGLANIERQTTAQMSIGTTNAAALIAQTIVEARIRTGVFVP